MKTFDERLDLICLGNFQLDPDYCATPMSPSVQSASAYVYAVIITLVELS